MNSSSSLSESKSAAILEQRRQIVNSQFLNKFVWTPPQKSLLELGFYSNPIGLDTIDHQKQ